LAANPREKPRREKEDGDAARAEEEKAEKEGEQEVEVEVVVVVVKAIAEDASPPLCDARASSPLMPLLLRREDTRAIAESIERLQLEQASRAGGSKEKLLASFFEL
jgi:hypothetical protein